MLKHFALIAGALALSPAALAAPSTTGGYGGLALAGLVAEHEPGLGPHRRHVMNALLNGSNGLSFPSGQKISIRADKIACRASNVAISQRSCELTFGARVETIKGRRANELFATMIEAGVAGDAGAGSVFESLAHLDCAIDPNEVRQNAGGGASCTYDAGP